MAAAGNVERPPRRNPPAIMHPKFLMAARLGETQRLKDLLEEASSAPPDFALQLEASSVEGDSALHVVAACGGGDEFVESATIIHGKASHLLATPNKRGDMPLHCAARAGNARMVARLISLAKVEGHGHGVKEKLRATNKLGETALHEAVRAGDKDIVVQLMAEDPELATFPKDGSSPLYLAVLLEEADIARSLHCMSRGTLSYSGPDGQNALHAAVLRGKVMAEMVLDWNKGLTEQADQDGCTPLHFAASQAVHVASRNSKFPAWIRGIATMEDDDDVPLLLLQANPSSAYQPDKSGSFPIHVAVAVGADKTVSALLEMLPDNACLRDAKGRTFLHVAVEKKKRSIVEHACRAASLGWILNMRDEDGNTALHLAVQAGDTTVFFPLLRNRQVRMNLTNSDGQTPRDMSLADIPPGLSYKWQMIHRALTRAVANHGVYRWDQFEEEYILRPKRADEEKESAKLNNSTQTLGISSVLITTVAFGAAFAPPGGYVADDHARGGTPTLAGSFTFNAFTMANMLAFMCSSIGTIGLMYSGVTTVDLPIRQKHFLRSLFWVSSALTCLVAAFALGTYTVLAPVAHKTAVAICVLSPAVVLYRSAGRFYRMYALAGPLYARAGLPPLIGLTKDMFTRMLRLYWPFLMIFGWASCASK